MEMMGVSTSGIRSMGILSSRKVENNREECALYWNSEIENDPSNCLSYIKNEYGYLVQKLLALDENEG